MGKSVTSISKFCKILVLAICLSTIFLSCHTNKRTISVLGDSYSTFEGYTSPAENAQWYLPGKSERTDVEKVEQTWWWILCNENNLELDKNNSYSGSTICNTGYYNKDYKDRSFITRAKNIGNPDIIMVFGGTNDSWANVPLGSLKYENITDEDLYSFCPAMAYLGEYLHKNHKNSDIYFIINDGLKEEIVETTKAVCKHYNFTAIELIAIDKQNNHPSAKGMKQIAEQVAKSLK